MMYGGLFGRKLPGMDLALQQAAGQQAPEPLSERMPQQNGHPPPLEARRGELVPAAAEQHAMLASQSMPPMWDHRAKEVQQHFPFDQLRQLIRDELTSSRSNVHAASAPAQQPVQLIINNHSESNASSKTISSPGATPAPRRDEASQIKHHWITSPTNRMCIYTAVGLGLYILQGHLQYKWRLQEKQLKMDANLFARLVHMLPR
mmetsp:Transcript_56092/g.162443  ORF Transcript_56092/g.162443 Transcript_56092/m.162443 type:complete len:204 (+) Transcript_56092:121-732(+)